MSNERSSVPSSRPAQAGTHPYIIFHVSASLHENCMHGRMYTCGLHMNQRKELFVIHGTIFPIAARNTC